MTINETIKHLEELAKKHGDVEVFIADGSSLVDTDKSVVYSLEYRGKDVVIFDVGV